MAYKLKTRVFDKWQRKADVTDAMLLKAIEEMSNGLIDADLGGNVFKKRIALPGRGKRGGARTLLATNRDDRWIFLYGFPKNERDNITRQELQFLQRTAHYILSGADEDIKIAIAAKEFLEITNDDE